jgi:putative membrane protein
MVRTGLGMAFLGGLLVAIGLIAYHGAADVLAGVARVGWGLALVVAIRATALGTAGLAWRALLPAGEPRSPSVFIALRIVREAVNALLPSAQIGGDVLGGRLLTFFGVAGSLAGASIVVDTLVQAGTEFLFALTGLATLALVADDQAIIRWIASGSLVAALALFGFFLSLRLGLLRLVGRLAGSRTFGAALPGGMVAIDREARTMIGTPRRLATAGGLHLVAWGFGVGEIWVGLAAMGQLPSLMQALVLESLGQAVRSAAFPVPGALGIQEGGFILLCGMFGIGAETALALSLVKRVPDLVLGIPGLLGWQLLEGNRLLTRTR